MKQEEYLEGLVVGRQGKLADVWVASLNTLFRCHTRRQHLQIVCGDWVSVTALAKMSSSPAVLNDDVVSLPQGVVEHCVPRKNVFFRRDSLRTKIIAANVDQILGILAWDPLPSESLLMRWMVTAFVQQVTFIMVINKHDLAQYCPSEHPLWDWMLRYSTLGLNMIEVSAYEQNVDALIPYLKGKKSLLVGQSGSGKSSLINVLLPELCLETQDLSDGIGQGKHTTTTTQLYWLDEHQKTAIIDSPGMQVFGISGISKEAVLSSCSDIVPYIGKCKFRNCRHTENELGCAILEAVNAGSIHEDRWMIVQELLNEVGND
jgi:ribosome biogenesis GTPase / thiamine phosphate phosphatase